MTYELILIETMWPGALWIYVAGPGGEGDGQSEHQQKEEQQEEQQGHDDEHRPAADAQQLDVPKPPARRLSRSTMSLKIAPDIPPKPPKFHFFPASPTATCLTMPMTPIADPAIPNGFSPQLYQAYTSNKATDFFFKQLDGKRISLFLILTTSRLILWSTGRLNWFNWRLRWFYFPRCTWEQSIELKTFWNCLYTLFHT